MHTKHCPLENSALLVLPLFALSCDAAGGRLADELGGVEQDTAIESAEPLGPESLGRDRAPQRAAADCCVSGSEAGCSDVGVQACVCEVDAYCCNVAWDGICVGEVSSLGCGSCEVTAACCSTTTTPGCALSSVESCVCAADAYCCNVAWDGICVGEVTSLGCGSCEAIDLAITELTTPPTACRGENIGDLIDLVITNYGSDGVDNLFQVGWYLSSDDVLGGDPLLIGGRDQVASLAAGASTSVSVNSNIIRNDAPLGSNYLIVKIDEFDGVAETDEPNNIAAVPIEITTTCASEWAGQVGGTGSDLGLYVDVDGSGNVYALGMTSSPTIDLGGGPVPPVSTDLFLVSWDPAGNYRWSRLLGGSGPEFPGALGVDGAGNVYVAGDARGTLDLGGGALPLEGFRDLFVASYTTTGTHRWSQRHGAAGVGVGPNDMAVNASGDVVVVGRVNGSVDLGGGLRAGEGGLDVFALALDSSGGHRWSRLMGGTGSDGADGVSIDASGGALITGDMGSSADFGSGLLTGPAGLVVRVGSTGTTQWARTFGDLAQDAVLEPSGESYVVGSFTGTVDLGDGPHTAVGSDVLLAHYSSFGSVYWSTAGGSASTDFAGRIALDAAGNPIAIGSFSGASFDLGSVSIPGAGDDDVWLIGFDGTLGNPQWSSGFGSGGNEFGHDIAVSPTGAVLISGSFDGALLVDGTPLSTLGNADAFIASLRR
ncbi:MAG: CARDB domain-containing protein [Myxococcota bacterium]